MAKQTINQGTAPTGAGGDTFRTGSAKLQANDDEIYNYLGDGTNLNKLGTAAFKNTGTQAGNVMEVGAFGWGRKSTDGLVVKSKAFLDNMDNWRSGLDCYADPSLPGEYGTMIRLGFGTAEANRWLHDLFFTTGGELYLRHSTNSAIFGDAVAFLSRRNTTVDSNGFVKAASPIVKLYSEKIDLNKEAILQDIVFEKLGLGNYLIKGTTGFAQQGWYVETPKDANGNSLVAVVYEQLENQDISVKTYKKKFDIETSSIVADLEQAIDIPVGRWIDIRLQELPQPEFVPPVSNTPASFQPTGISQAVSEMMNGTEQ